MSDYVKYVCIHYSYYLACSFDTLLLNSMYLLTYLLKLRWENLGNVVMAFFTSCLIRTVAYYVQ